jgi:hypothetical protein
MLYYAHGSETTDLSHEDIKNAVFEAFDKMGSRKKVLALPPDFTRYHSQAGYLTCLSHEYYGKALKISFPPWAHTPP